jgi:hypothetical protein
MPSAMPGPVELNHPIGTQYSRKLLAISIKLAYDKLTDKVFPTTRLVASDGDLNFRSIFLRANAKTIDHVHFSAPWFAATFAVSRAWNFPKRYLIRSYFEPQVSDRSVSYLQVN